MPIRRRDDLDPEAPLFNPPFYPDQDFELPPPLPTSPPKPPTPTPWGGTVDAYAGPYAQLPGYDYGKLSDPTRRGSGKYNSDVALFSQALAATGAQPGQAGLQSVYDWMKGQGSNVSWGGKDVFDFGGGNLVDVMANYNPSGAGSSWSFQDPRGVAPADSTPPPSFTPPPPSTSPLPSTPWAPAQPPNPSRPFFTPRSNSRRAFDPLPDDWMSATPPWEGEGWKQLLQSSLDTIKNPVGSAQFEALRQPIDKARRTSLNNVRDALANRGTLVGGGDYGNAVGRIEERLAPDFASAVQRASVENTAGARQSALGTLRGITEQRTMQGDLALRQLDQHRQWNQFLADFGLRREQVQELLEQGRVDELLRYWDIWNDATNIASEGRI